METNQKVEQLLTTASATQAIYATFTQEQVDAIVKNVSEKLADKAAELGALANQETGFGNKEDKTTKNLVAAQEVYEYIKDMKTVDIISRKPEEKLIEVAKPMGVIAALVPMTNPTSTVIFKSLLALKTRNAVIFSPHPHAMNAIAETVRLVNAAAVEAGAPDGLVLMIDAPTLEDTQDLMKHPKTALILATGGGLMVRAAYSSGNPAIGVGPGNSPAYIEASADIDEAVSRIIASKTFDYGTICASEQSIIVEEAQKAAVLASLEKHQAYLLNEEEKAKVSAILLRENGTMNPAIVGKNALAIADLAGITIPENTTILVAETDEVSHTNPYSREKLTTVLGLFTVQNFEEGLAKTNELLENEGMGHTATMHSQDQEKIEAFGVAAKASRILINTPSTFGAIGYSTALAPSFTLGCGTQGGSSISDNVEPRHLLNINRVVMETKDVR